MKLFTHLLIATLCWSFTSIASADEQLVEVKKGVESQIVVAPNSGTTQVKFAFYSSDPYVTTLTTNIVAPGKAKISFKALGVPASYSLEQALAAFKSAYTLKVTGGDGKFKDFIQLDATGSSGGKGGGENVTYCNGVISETEYHAFKEIFLQYGGYYPTEDELCDLFVGPEWDTSSGSGGSTDGGSGAELTGAQVTTHLLKDMCARGKSKYLAVATIDLSKISDADKAAGSTISLTLQESEYKGGKAQKLKANGDGKYKGRLFINEGLLSGGDRIMAVEFAAGKIKKIRVQNEVPVKKALYYKGKFLVVGVPSGGVISNRSGTIFDYNSSSIYGTCFHLSARDQEKNGYP